MSRKNSELLGMPFGTAAHRLRKSLMFAMAKRLSMDICHRCEKQIQDEADLTIEHKDAWRRADDPVAAFFDLENVAFSHMRCNYGAALRTQIPLYPSKFARNQAKTARYRARNGKERNARRNALRAQRLNGGIAQSEERAALNREVAGADPASPANLMGAT